MRRLLCSLALLCALGPGVVDGGPRQAGRAFHYRAGLFRLVAANRGMQLSATVDGYASTPDCGRVDVARPWVVRAQLAGGAVERYQIVDCSDPRDLAAQRAKGLIIEVDYATAARHGFAWPPGEGKAPAVVLGFERLK